MAPFLVSLLVSCLALGVQAGGRGLMPELQPPVRKSLRSNATEGRAQKRWHGVETGTGNDETHLWPNKKIVYAFDEPIFSKPMNKHFVAAFGLWKSSGLSETEFTYEEVSKEACESDRGKCLLIMFENEGSHGTIPALPPTSRTFEGPYMKLVLPEPLEEGETEPPADQTWEFPEAIAHELGHSWGLLHEHQMPAYWSKEFNPDMDYDGTAFTSSNFACETLEGYEDALFQAQRAFGGDTERAKIICHDVREARNFGFAADMYLPDQDNIVGNKLALGSLGADDVDWDSIMIYNTYLLGTKLLTKPNGEDIVVNKAPSQLDVQAIQALYSGTYSRPTVTLLNEARNAQQASFLKIACST
ncbi:hypothetical protein CI238_10716 [Colletotrichum incanum]|uniref:Uncharacterized protein n=1 Tax=Colletotrichum incanum TaxID=1573173 RepID=A0A167CC11_COLIC|nr:hypothetical protein CI238_10716 [Colletotrichum incanum]